MIALRLPLALAQLCVVGAASLALAQTAPAVRPPAAPAPADDETVRLSIFEVTEDKDLGYAASTAMSGTRTNEKLGDLPNAISVMTREFPQDLAFNTDFDAVGFAMSAENTFHDLGSVGAIVGTGPATR